MLKLLPRQRAFVRAALDTGRANNTLHARMAGYCGTDETLRVTGYRLAHDPDIQAAIIEEAKKRLSSSAAMAVSVLVQLAETAPEAKDRLKAIDMILNRVGMHAKTEHTVNVEHGTSKDTIEAIHALAKKLGVDVVPLLGHSAPAEAKEARPDVIDAEYEEIEDEEQPAEGEEQW